MLTISQQGSTLVLASDDANAENAVLEAAIEYGAPHWLPDYREAPIGADGILRFAVKRDEWGSLREVIEHLAAFGLDAAELEAIEDAVEQAIFTSGL